MKNWLEGGLKHCLRPLKVLTTVGRLIAWACLKRPGCFLDTEAAVRLSTTVAWASSLDTAHCVRIDTKATEASKLRILA